MKKFTIIFLLCNVVLFSFLACKMDAGSSDSSTDPKMWKVTVIPNGGSGLTKDVYDVENGKTLSALSNIPTMTYATFTGYKDLAGNVFKLNETTVTDNITIVMQWQWKTFNNCTSKVGNMQDFILSGDVEGIDCLIQNGGNITDAVADLPSAFLYAARDGNAEVLKYLLEKGADLKQKDSTNTDAFMRASQNGNVDMLKFLYYKGASAIVRNSANSNALIIAAGYGKLDAVKYILTLDGVSINEKTNDGMTALMNACASFTYNTVDTVKYLATYPGVSLKDKATGGTYPNLDALGIAQKIQSILTSTSTYYNNNKSIVDFLTPLWN